MEIKVVNDELDNLAEQHDNNGQSTKNEKQRKM